MKKRVLLSVAGLLAIAGVALVAAKRDDHEFKVSKNLDIFFAIFKELNLNYVDEPDPDRIVPEAIDAMLGDLDPYTTYIPEKDREDYQFQVMGLYGGIGAVIQKSDTDLIQVREIYSGTPSDDALLPGDRFLSIDGESMRGKDVAYVRSHLRGVPGEKFEAEIERPGEPKPFKVTIKRELVKLNAVDYYGFLGKENEVGYIQLRSFESDCYHEFYTDVCNLRDLGAKKLIIDLRGNTGGLLDESLKILNMFVPQGSQILETRGRRRSGDRIYTAPREPLDSIMPIVVMINRGSASASEIVAGALQDLDRAVIVGQRSFGKGLVQATREVPYKGLLKLTTAKYYTPSGRCIQAIDYSNRDADGAVGYVPDSLIHEFHTRGGRPVYDGGGISPDVLLDPGKYSPVTLALLYTDQAFPYLIDLKKKGQTLKLDANNHVTDEAFADFVKYVKSRPGFKYRTAAQDAYEKLIAAAKSDGIYSADSASFAALGSACKADLERDMYMAKDDICHMLEEENIRNKDYRFGALGYILQYDQQVAEAVKLLEDEDRFNGILNGTVPSHAGDKRAANNKN